jgi:hypothetical protein
VFNLHGSGRLAAWREFRDTLEESNQPFQKVVDLWTKAPFRSDYLNPSTPDEWPDPWELVLKSDLDELAISLGMLYTIKLTQRFSDTKCEIHTIASEEKSKSKYFLIVDDQHVLNLDYGLVSGLDAVDSFQTSLIWSKEDRI